MLAAEGMSHGTAAIRSSSQEVLAKRRGDCSALLAAAAGITLDASPPVHATTSVFVSVESGQSAADLSQGATYAENQVTSFANLTKSELVLQPVVADSG